MSLHSTTAFSGTPFTLAMPFVGNHTHVLATEGRFLDEALQDFPDLPDRFHDHGEIWVQQGTRLEKIPRRFWARGHLTFRLRLKPQPHDPVKVFLAHAQGRGGSKGTKSLITIVGTLALLAVGTLITGGALAGIAGTGLFAAGSTSAQLLAAGVTFVGRLALSLAAKPAAKEASSAEQQGLGSASVSGNTVAPGQSFDYVAGKRIKLFPKMACFPLVELVGDDELAEAAYMFEGPHELENPKVEGVALTEVPGLTFALDDGLSASPPRLLERYGYQTTPQMEMKAHARDKDNPTRLANQGSPESSLPQPVVMTSKHDPDEIWLQLLWPSNFGKPAGDVDLVMPFRLKLRVNGTSTWINLPELMFHSRITGKMSKKIVLKWQAEEPVITDVPLNNGAWESFHDVPAQNLTPGGSGRWVADTSFKLNANKNGTKRVERKPDGFALYLDPAVFPRGQRWDVSIIRGCVTRVNDWGGSSIPFNPATYTPTTGGNVYSLFDYWQISGVQYTANGNTFYSTDTAESCVVMRFASVWNKRPLPKAGHATIEVTGRNVNVSQLSVEAGAIVRTWNGSEFDQMGTSHNPADHFFEIACGRRSPEPMNERQVNVPELGLWHAENEAASRKVGLILAGAAWEDALDSVASAGLARRKEGRLLGVSRSRNTSALGIPARQVFNHLNMLSFEWNKTFPRVPDAVRVSFRNRALDFEQDQRLVIRPGLTSADVQMIVQQETDAIVDAAQVEEFYMLYLSSAWHRDHHFTLETWIEGLAAEPSDIIEVNHLMLEESHASARITRVVTDGAGDVTALELDMVLAGNTPQGLQAVADLTVIEDLRMQGIRLGASVLTANGPVVQPVATVAAGDKLITFDAPFTAPDVKAGQVVSMGPRGLETRRFEVLGWDATGERFFSLTVVPEAPDMWSF